MNILICEKLDLAGAEVLSGLSRHDHVRFVDEPLTADNAAQFADVDVVSPGLQSELTADVLGRLDHVRLIAIRGTGVDSIDVGYCKAHGIAGRERALWRAQSVAEHTFALLLADQPPRCRCRWMHAGGSSRSRGLRADLAG